MRSELCGLKSDVGHETELIHVAIYTVTKNGNTDGETHELHFWASTLAHAKKIAWEQLEEYLREIYPEKNTEFKCKLNNNGPSIVMYTNGDRFEFAIVRIYCRPSYKLCGECKSFQTDETGFQRFGICTRDNSDTNNLTWCKFGDYITPKGEFNGKKCKQCGYWLMGKEKEFCSVGCINIYNRLHKKVKLYEHVCQICGKTYKSQSTSSKYCSDECRRIVNKQKEAERREKRKASRYGVMI